MKSLSSLDTYRQILADLKKKDYKPVYFLEGEESFFIDQITDYIANNILEEAERGFNLVTMYGRDSDINQVITAAKRYPMMSSRQIVIVKEAQHLDKIELLAEYLKQPQSSTILVVNFKQKLLDKRSALAKQLKNPSFVYFEAKKLYDNQLPDWIIGYTKLKKGQIDQTSAQLMANHIGADLSRLSNELDKLLLNLPADKCIITPALIEEFSGINKDFNVFELQNALSKGDKKLVYQIAQYMGNNPKNNPLPMVIGALYAYFRKIWTYHWLEPSTKADQRKAASKMGISPFFYRDYVSAARTYNPRRLFLIFGHLREIDLQFKGKNRGGASDADLLIELAYKLTH